MYLTGPGYVEQKPKIDLIRELTEEEKKVYYNIVHKGGKPEGEKRRRSRWDEENPTIVPGVPKYVPDGLSQEQIDALAVRSRLEELCHALKTGDFGLHTPRERSPSPPPVYDRSGKRYNTREQRARERAVKERADVVEKAKFISPIFIPPSDMSKNDLKKSVKVYIPIKEYPDYNFVGFIIGPRGHTQRQLERDSGAKISIRGKGAVKEGRIKKQQPDEDDDLHVNITADDDISLEKAYRMLIPLLSPSDQTNQDLKQMQLMELSQINGTVRNQTWFQPLTVASAGVVCSICGESSHATIDCPLKGKNVAGAANAPTNDENFDNYMRAIGMDPEHQRRERESEESFAQFKADIEATAKSQEVNAQVQQDFDDFINSISGNPMPSAAPMSAGNGLLQMAPLPGMPQLHTMPSMQQMTPVPGIHTMPAMGSIPMQQMPQMPQMPLGQGLPMMPMMQQMQPMQQMQQMPPMQQMPQGMRVPPAPQQGAPGHGLLQIPSMPGMPGQ